MEHKAESRAGFGTFQGVFRPTILTILGALMYLREGWVIGHAGLGGFVLILLGMYTITTTTALSMASITTNIRIGKGGVFSIICQSLGLEAGGAIGLPFYLAQSLGGALYLFAFAEGWQMIFPGHPLFAVVLAAYVVVFLLSLVGASLAFKTQSVVLVGILIAMGSVFMGLKGVEFSPKVHLWPEEGGQSMTDLFALFFPAATGVLVGASMSGSLENPRRSIPQGTLAAVFVSFAVYLGLAVWYERVATPEELRMDYTIMTQRAFWGPAVLIGLLSSTFSASISSFVAAPRVLQALASFRVLPFGEHLSQVTEQGEPRRALVVTAGIVGLGLMSGSLDAIAPMLTVFFLITYASINMVLLIEQSLDLPSFRPRFRVPRWVPLLGSLSSLVGILLTSPVVGLLALGFVGVVYVWLVSRNLDTPFETARSGLFVNLAGWAAKKVEALPSSTERSWKPDLLMPVQSSAELLGSYRLLRALTSTRGSIKLVGLATCATSVDLKTLEGVTEDLRADGIYTSSTFLEVADFGEGAVSSLSVLQGAFFPPNIVFLSLSDKREDDVQSIMVRATEHSSGVVVFAPHQKAGLGRERVVNLWVRDQSPDWQLSLKMASLDLSLLLALQLMEEWSARLHLICVVDEEAKVVSASRFLEELCEEARIPADSSTVQVVAGSFREQLTLCPRADLNVFGLADRANAAWMSGATEVVGSACLFVRASGKESALA